MIVDDVRQVLNYSSHRTLHLIVRMVNMHLDLAQREMIRERQRVLGAVLAVALGALLIMLGLLLTQVLLALWIYSHRPDWLWIISGLIGGDIVGGGLIIAIALHLLRRPYMVETRSQLKETLFLLLAGEEE